MAETSDSQIRDQLIDRRSKLESALASSPMDSQLLRLLDEVDAALDEVNLGRFLNLMKRIKNQTQFILITHNFKTMEVADYIYGTTMAEPNITSIYAMKLEKKVPKQG